MNLGIAGRTAIVCAASKGLGRACARALAENGVNLVINARTADALQMVADEIAAACKVSVQPVAADITTPEGRSAVLAVCPDPDILVNNAGGPPPGDFRDWDEADWIAAVNANMITAIMLMRAVVDGMGARGFGRIVNITSAAVKSPIPTLGLSNGARAGLTGFVAGLARQVARRNVTVNNLLPGPFDTDRLWSNLRRNAADTGVAVEAFAAERAKANPTGRFGRPEEFGATCAFLCSMHAGYMTGQNVLLDGGAFNSTF
jgi:3-oxoacyl-[acyl-carrier protein] reductase